MTTKTKALRGYKRRDSISHRTYNRATSINRYKKTGRFTYVKDGSGHRAGEKWGAEVGIDPESTHTKYGKNSPSFDEGVYLYKQTAKAKALLAKKDTQR